MAEKNLLESLLDHANDLYRDFLLIVTGDEDYATADNPLFYDLGRTAKKLFSIITGKDPKVEPVETPLARWLRTEKERLETVTNPYEILGVLRKGLTRQALNKVWREKQQRYDPKQWIATEDIFGFIKVRWVWIQYQKAHDKILKNLKRSAARKARAKVLAKNTQPKKGVKKNGTKQQKRVHRSRQ